MNINATLFGQMITFALFVWFTMRFVWPILEKVLKERQEKIAQGLMAAERGHKTLEVAEETARKQIREAREQANHIVENAHKQAVSIVDQAKEQVLQERAAILHAGRNELEQERLQAKAKLKHEVVQLVLATTEKLLTRRLTEKDQEALLDIAKVESHD